MQPSLKVITLVLLMGICYPPNGKAQSDIHRFRVDASEFVADIQPTMYGIFFEDINFAADGGLYAEMVKNRSFEFTEPKMGWSEPKSDRFSLNKDSGMGSILKSTSNPTNSNFLRVVVENDQQYELLNEGFRGMGVREDQRYDLSINAALRAGSISAIHFNLVGEDGEVLGKTSITLTGTDWKNYESVIEADKTAAKAQLKITFAGTGTIDLDMISLFPQETWKGRKKGLRKDLVQLLYDLKPGFLRFPGGCIVEGRTLARRYQWKKTVGPVAARELLVNRWNTEFAHRPTPDYYQSFGLGFFEYFQLAEDLGAAPLPILSCGMACQFNTGELVPIDELDPYVQDALDLIEFANGDSNTPWGKIRAEMGHPEPFHLKYIGVGNEQWGPEYIKRYKVFEKAIKESYPDIVIISGSGPFPDGEQFEYGMAALTQLNAEIVDEHYYRPAEWFREHADRYDHYDRNGPRIFAGEYAAQSVAIASPENKNNWNCALSEAAFMTGLERNADLVVMTSYAPLMAHAEGWQWTPDMIWFNNLESYGTPNYYVQKMYSNNPGTKLLQITENGQPIIGQKGIYASATLDENTNELILKIANSTGQSQEVNVEVQGGKVAAGQGSLSVLTGEQDAENSFENPQRVYPRDTAVNFKGKEVRVRVEPLSFSVLRVPLKLK